MCRIIAIIATIFMLLSPGVSGALHAHAMTGMDDVAGMMMSGQNEQMADTDATDCCHAPVNHCNTMSATISPLGVGWINNGRLHLHVRPERARMGRVITADPPPPRI